LKNEIDNLFFYLLEVKSSDAAGLNFCRRKKWIYVQWKRLNNFHFIQIVHSKLLEVKKVKCNLASLLLFFPPKNFLFCLFRVEVGLLKDMDCKAAVLGIQFLLYKF